MSDKEIVFTKSGKENTQPVKPEILRSCATCMFMQKVRISPTDLRQHMFCYRFPPHPVGVQSPQGMQVNSMHSPVQANEWCYEYRPPVAASAAND